MPGAGNGDRGRQVAASASGYVSYLAPLGQHNGGYGNYVMVNHGAGWTSLYAHLQGYAVSQNQAVTRGDIVGFVGSTGNSDGSHLHLEQRRNGSPQPVRYSGGLVIAFRQYQSDNCANSTPPPQDDDSGDDGGSSQLAQTIGERATATGDFDGDGFDDLAIGSPGEDSGVADSGFVHLIYGSATGLNARVGGLRQGSGLGGADEAGDYLGSALATADFDGDGFDDLAIGSPGENSGVADSGLVHIIFGSASGLNTARTAGLRQGSGLAGADEAGDYLGASLATGDFDRDGFDDLAIGTPGENSAVADSGFVHLIFGSATGLNARPGGLRQGSGLGGADEAGDYLGSALASGDFDHDGFADLAIGTPGENSAVADGGFVHVIFGSVTGLNARPGGLRQGSGLGNADEAGDYLGSALASGDFDHDGFADLAIGSPGENSAVADGGLVHVIFGSATGLNARPGGLRQGSGLGNADEAGDYLGSALASGDFDHDGFADLAIGTPGENSGVTDSGFVHLIFGSATGLNARPGGLRQGSGLGNADEAGDYLGAALASGDFDRDGFADLAIGSPGENSGVADGGFVHTIFGSVTGLSVSRTMGFRQGNGLGGADEAGDYLGGGFPGERFW